MRANRYLLTTALFTAFVAAASAQSLDPVIAKYLAWRGGPALARLEGLEMTGTVETAGLKGTAHQIVRSPDSAALDYDLGVVKGADRFSPKGAWTTTPANQVEVMAPEEVARNSHDLDLLLARTFLDKDKAKVSRLADEARDGATFAVIRVEYAPTDTHDYFIDAASGALAGVRNVDASDESFTALSDWRMVDGVRLPFRESTSFKVESRNATLVWSHIAKATPDAALFDKPEVDGVKITLDGGKDSSGWIGYDFFRQARVELHGTVNGHEVPMLLDSGAEVTVLDAAFAKEIGIRTAGDFHAEGTGGSTTAGMGSGVSLKVGALHLDNLTVGIFDLSKIAKRHGMPMPVILGKEVFNEMIVDVDFPNRRIAFHRPAAFHMPEGAIKVPLASASGLRAVEVSVEGRAPVAADFDIGNGGAFFLQKRYWETEMLTAGRRTSTLMGGAIGGSMEMPVGTLKTVRIAGVDFHDVPTTFNTAERHDNRLVRANVGIQILSRFRVITDYARDAMYLVPDAAAIAKPFPKDRSGLDTRFEGDHLEVTHVAKASPAEAAGWKVGDTITAVDGTKIDGSYYVSGPWTWTRGAADTQVTLTLADGTRRMLKLADYY